MDYAGIDARNLRYAVNRLLTATEEREWLDVTTPAGVPACSGLSVIRFSASRLELVDRWYPVKGFNTWLSVLGALAFVPTSSYLLVNLIIFGDPFKEEERWILWCFWIFIVPVSLFILAGIVWLFRSECFRWTHYPIRLDRTRRKVHFFRQDGTVATGHWERLFFFIGEATTPPIGKTHDIRAHVLSEDGRTVLETFSLGYVYMGSRRDLLGLWEFIRQYMEGSDEVVARICAEVSICIPVHDRKEGFVFGVVRTFAGLIHWPWLHLVACLPFSFIAIGRWIAMSTCRIPIWPNEIEHDAAPEKDRWYRDWRDNPKLGFLERTWPLICTMLGIGAGTYIIYLIERQFG